MNEKNEKTPDSAPKNAPINTATPVKPRVVKIPRKFEIFIEEMSERDDGQIEWRPVNMGHESGKPVIITVNSPRELQELQDQYKMVGQRFKIIREVDPPTPADIQRMAKEQGIDLTPPQPATPPQPVPPPASVQQSAMPAVPQQMVAPTQQQVAAVQAPAIIKPKPKFVTIGDVQLKYDGDRVYQKQWIALNSNEAQNIRVVNDTNNKIFPLIGKHVEVKKWVLVEEQGDSDEIGGIFNEQL